MDDEAAKFSKRKYEALNDVRRRMGKKKKQLMINKVKKSKPISKMPKSKWFVIN